jgi:hypothetical protein
MKPQTINCSLKNEAPAPVLVQFELNILKVNTPKALANFGPGLLQPWAKGTQRSKKR